ncbi:MAG: metallophosphoesterase, partial [Maricaulaceae bacterium]
MRGDGDDLAPDVALAGGRARFDPSGALWLAEHRTLVVSDLHLEKGSSYGLRGQMLPPYDSRATLERLGAVIARYAPDRVISLGDSFHDAGAAARIDAQDADTLMDLIRPIADWVWIEGNHDPAPPARFGGPRPGAQGLGGLNIRQDPSPGQAPGRGRG